VINAAFSHDVLDLGNNSEPIQVDNDAVLVLRVNQHVPTQQLRLSEVAQQIKSRLVKKAAEEQASELGKNLLNSGDDHKRQDLVQFNQLHWTLVEKATRESDKSDNTVNDLAFSLLGPEAIDGINLANGDYVVVKLKQVNDGVLSELDKEQRDSLIQQIQANYGTMDYDLYVNSLIKQAKIERY
jgi:peptidyl-prolyl cis-trans isomerase D